MKLIKKIVIMVLIGSVLFACNAASDGVDNSVSHTPGDEQLPPPTAAIPDNAQRGEIFISESQLLIMESYPVQVSLSLSGELPTPCNIFQADVSGPDADNQIHVEAYTLIDPAATCIQMLEPFEEGISIPMQGQADGDYSVWLNGELVGEFSYPG